MGAISNHSNTQNKRKRSKYTRRACTLCKSAHAKCGHERPCKRCISLGRADECVDAERKKRRRRQKYDGTFFDLSHFIPKIKNLPEWDPHDPNMRPYEEIEQEMEQANESADKPPAESGQPLNSSQSPPDQTISSSQSVKPRPPRLSVPSQHHMAHSRDAKDTQANDQHTKQPSSATARHHFDMSHLDEMSKESPIASALPSKQEDCFFLDEDVEAHRGNSWMPGSDAEDRNIIDDVPQEHVQMDNTIESVPTNVEDMTTPENVQTDEAASTALQLYQPQRAGQQASDAPVDNAQLMKAIEGGNLERFSPELVQQLVFCYLKQRDELNQLRSTISYLQGMIANYMIQQKSTTEVMGESHVDGFDW